MSNRGVFPGLVRGGYQDYIPELKAFVAVGTGAPTQPVLGTSTRWGRWSRKSSGLLHCYGQIIFDSTATFGLGDHTWAVSLPYPANRSSGGADLPTGSALLWQGAAANPQLTMNCALSLLDAPNAGLFGPSTQEDSFLQIFLPWSLSMGTGSITSGTTNTTITHNLGLTPNAFDIHVVPTATTSNNAGIIYVDTITPTQFNVNCKANPGASNLAFSWKARCEGNTSVNFAVLMNSKRPWAWASAHSIGWNVTYEARR